MSVAPQARGLRPVGLAKGFGVVGQGGYLTGRGAGTATALRGLQLGRPYRKLPMDEPLITVGIFSTPVEAELARNWLEEKGITAVVMDAETVGMLFHASGALGGVKVQVTESDAARARAVLASRDGPAALSADDDYGLEDRIQAGGRPRLRHGP